MHEANTAEYNTFGDEGTNAVLEVLRSTRVTMGERAVAALV